jgi:hypothetical protein
MGVCKVVWEEATRVEQVAAKKRPSANIKKNPEIRRAVRKSFETQNILELFGN